MSRTRQWIIKFKCMKWGGLCSSFSDCTQCTEGQAILSPYACRYNYYSLGSDGPFIRLSDTLITKMSYRLKCQMSVCLVT